MCALLLPQETDVQRVEQQGLCGALHKDASWKCLLLTLLMACCLGFLAWCRLAEVTKVIINFSLYPIKSTRRTSPCEDGYVFVPVAFLLLLFAVYLTECWHCEARRRLRGPRADAAQVLERVRRMREARPVVWWRAVSYHYVRRKRQVTRFRNGDAYAATQVYYERVNTHTASSCFVYRRCGVQDISKDLQLRADGPLTRIRFSKGFAFANVEAATEFEEQRARFFAEHERRDDYLEMREGLDVGNFREEQVVACGDSLPWLHSAPVFWLCSLLLLSWPLRLFQQCRTAYVHYEVTKLFGVNYETGPSTSANNNNNRRSFQDSEEPASGLRSLPSRSQLSHDSSDLECCINDNLSVVPSYSEALLMDAGPRPMPRSATLFYPSPLVRRSPGDPFQGRSVTTPTEDPPDYEEALRLPVLSRLRRSLTDRGDLCRSGASGIVVRADNTRVGRGLVSMETSL